METYQLKRRSDLHLARKTWHVFGVMAMVVAHHLLSTDQAFKVAAVAGVISIGGDLLRHQFTWMNRWILRFFGPLMREHERESLAGTSYLMLGTLVIMWLFPRPVVSLTLTFLAVADPLASYFGIRYGKDKLIGSKSLQGTLAAFVACTAIAVGYLVATGLMTERLVIVSLLAGLIGAISELIPIAKLDDNLTFPIVNATGLWLLFTVFGGLV